MKKYFSIALLYVVVNSAISISNKCDCNNLVTESDCLKSETCSWNSTSKSCKVQSTTTDRMSSLFCKQFTSTTCYQQDGCAWVNTECILFTGCTPYPKSSNSDCQAISTKCITDGIRCVRISNCSSYKTVISCLKNTLPEGTNNYCYWNGFMCSDANTCDKLPLTLDTDEKCRNLIPTCTTNNVQKGCTESGVDCYDQKYEFQCLFNKAKNQKCFWRDSQCYSLSCENASIALVTDEGCSNYLPTCTTTSKGGCTTRTTCQAAQIEAACVKNALGTLCYWNGSECVDLTCDSLSKSIVTNKACETFKEGCITKKDGGCIQNTTCSAIAIEAACVKNSLNALCMWKSDLTACQDMICINSPSSNNTHELCTAFLSNCTVNSTNSGCVERTCDNAPTTIADQNGCDSYIKNGGCILKKAGGCKKMANCSSFELQSQCLKDLDGNSCFWDTDNCKLKICINATLKTHELCQAFLIGCTVNALKTGCIDATCSLLSTASICLKDKDDQLCIWKDKCYEINCNNAGESYDTHAKCYSRLNSCTVNQNLKGCTDLPNSCNSLTQSQCFINRNQQSCEWVGSSCLPKTCETASATQYNTTSTCQSYISTCMEANDKKGCISITTACNKRSVDNCLFQVNSSPKCALSNLKCIDLDCSSASGNTFITNSACQAYISSCMVNNTLNGCMKKPSICGGLNSTQCQDGVKLNGSDCAWNGAQCLDKSCSLTPNNVIYTTFNKCQEWMKGCIPLGSYGVGCVNKGQNCTDLGQNQCYTTIDNKPCYWNSNQNVCLPQICENSVASTTQQQCQSWSSSCSINQNFNGCVSMETTCNLYTKITECGWSSTDGRCFWNDGTCQQAVCGNFNIISSSDCKALVGLECTSNGTNCVPRECSGTYGPTTVTSQTDCQNQSTRCAINQAQNGCISIKDNCIEYTTGTDCGWSKIDGRCYMNGSTCYRVSSCVQIYYPSYSASICFGVTDFRCTNVGVCVDQPCSNASPKTTQAQCQSFSTKCAINSVGDDCVLFQETCAGYTVSADCGRSKIGKCFWDSTANNSTGACTDSACSTASPNTTQIECQAFSLKCAITSSGSLCQTIQVSCSSYTSSTNCTYSIQGKCQWSPTANNNLGACIDALCTSAPNKTSQANCQSYSKGCSVNAGLNDCLTIKDTCSTYTASTDCGYSLQGKCSYNGTTNKCEDSSCANASPKATYSDCQSHSILCTVNSAGSACISIKASCKEYVQSDCKQSANEGLCLWNASQSKCLQATCVNASSGQIPNTTVCSGITALKCQFVAEKFCKDRECDGLYGPSSQGVNITSQSDCQNWSSSCAINHENNGCVSMKSKCSEYVTIFNCGWSQEGRCVYGSACQLITCSTIVLASYSKSTCEGVNDSNLSCTYFAGDLSCSLRQCHGPYGPPSILTTQTACQNWFKNCSINKDQGGCTYMMSSCGSYDENNCGWSNAGPCYWNVSTSKCIDKNCSQGNTQNTNQLCENFYSKCTVQRSYGCIDFLSQCSLYMSSEQCHKTNNNQNCYWNSQTNVCTDVSCDNFNETFTTHLSCENALNSCTVQANTDGTLKPGCMSKVDCTLYKNEDQCQSDFSGKYCQWDVGVSSTTCIYRTCATAPVEKYDTHDLCYAYILYTNPLPKDRCTVKIESDKITGCQQVTECTSYITELQCQRDIYQNQCYWIAESNKCEIKSCSNAPDLTKCSSHLSNCTYEGISCRIQVCEDFLLTTDDLCKAKMSKCTSNGTSCVNRMNCNLTIFQSACTIDVDGQICEWVTETSVPFCSYKSCATAPTTLKTEIDCQNYLTGCTVKLGGGCVTKGSCSSADTQQACTKSIDGIECVWETTNLKCRDKDCQDYTSTTQAYCATLKLNCDYDGEGHCTTIKACSLKTKQSECIEGPDGPCLWVNGTCHKYLSCESLDWNTDAKCKLISSNCTTNGSNCVPITKCSDTNTNGGCVTGTDGICVQTPPSYGSTDPEICQLFTSCANIFYNSHSLCQAANSQCTTNLKSGCNVLDTCSSYVSQDNCKINKVGQLGTGDKITSSGICLWDTLTSSCRDQVCSDLTGTVNSDCSSFHNCYLSGTNCKVRQSCTTYSQSQCLSQTGTEGYCKWDVSSCRAMICSDISSGFNKEICQLQVSSCISDGTKCIDKSTCGSYKTQKACNYNGTDGICAWKANLTCVIMSSCDDAKNDSVACLQRTDSCYWKVVDATTSYCENLTCAQKGAASECVGFLSFDQKLLTYCSQVNKNECSEVDPTILTTGDSCFIGSLQYYSWSGEKCTQCFPVVPSANSTQETKTTYLEMMANIFMIFVIILE